MSYGNFVNAYFLSTMKGFLMAPSMITSTAGLCYNFQFDFHILIISPTLILLGIQILLESVTYLDGTISLKLQGRGEQHSLF